MNITIIADANPINVLYNVFILIVLKAHTPNMYKI